MRHPGSETTRSSVSRMSARRSSRRPAMPWIRVIARTRSAISGQRLLQRGAMGGARLLVALAPGGRDADEDAAPVVRAHPALGEPVLLEPPDHARERALTQVQRLA